MTILSKIFQNSLGDYRKCLSTLSSEKELLDVISILLKTRDQEKKIFSIGNGGSASTASHFTSDLLKTCILKNTKRFQAICLSDNIPVLTAWANDTSYEKIYSEQLENFISINDVVIAFSGSGTSKNIVTALKLAKSKKAFVIGFTGKSGGDFPSICDITVKIDSKDMLMIESMHVLLCHIIVNCIRNTGTPEFTYE